MSDIPLPIFFLLLMIVAVIIASYPLLKNNKATHIAIVLVLVFGSLVGYHQWGSWENYNTFQKQQKLLSSIKSPEELINKIKQRLQQEPDSAKGWYLLGRLYYSQNQTQLALEAFTRAHHLEPNNEQFTVNYVQSLWHNNHQRFNSAIRENLLGLLNKNPEQPDALSMLAMDAYQSKFYDKAIDYWTLLLKIVPADSEDAIAIRKAITKARAQL